MYSMRKPGRWPSTGRLISMLLVVLDNFASAYNLDPNSTQSIKTIAKSMTKDMLSFYHGDQPGGTPGLLPDPYYWWEAGAMMGALIEYWYYTGDAEYVDITKQGLLFQVGDNNDYMPINQTRTEGNDDQGFWGLAVMSAAEYNFPNPPPDQPQWLALAQAVFNTQAARWDPQHCNGGLRWQIFQWNTGFDYKNSISQACFFALSARLALYTGNQTYAKWAEKTWDWMWGVDFIQHERWYVYDGAHIENNCTKVVPYQFSYNAGGFILGAAAMYNLTESDVWKRRLDNLLVGVKVFFTGPEKNIMTEVACEPVNLCNLDQQSFKAYLSRWLAATTQWAPHTYPAIMPYLRASAIAAAKQCTGGRNKRMCGLKWNKDKYDGSTGVGQQMAAMEVTLSCMVLDRAPPKTSDSGGTSKGDPNAGSQDIGRSKPADLENPVGAGAKAGAAVLTAAVVGLLLVGIVWLFLDETSDKGLFDQFQDFYGEASVAAAGLLVSKPGAKVIQRKNSTRAYVDEKAAQPTNKVTSDGSSQTSEERTTTVPPPVEFGTMRNMESRSRRRLSNMPRGWPHNPSVRGSVISEPDGIYPAPDRQSLGETAEMTAPALANTSSTPEDSSVEDTHPVESSKSLSQRPSRFTEKLESPAEEGSHTHRSGVDEPSHG